MTKIIGIDPGSRVTGFGVIHSDGNQHRYLGCGCIKLKSTSLNNRLYQIYNSISQLIEQFKPQETAIEQVFMHRNPMSALKLGQARGAAIVATTKYELAFAEYSPRQIKQTVVGYGGASKAQVANMAMLLLNISKIEQLDATDALAVALCHALIQGGYNKITALRVK